MPAPKPEDRSAVFIHGLWVHNSAWQPWQDPFAAAADTTARADGRDSSGHPA